MTGQMVTVATFRRHCQTCRCLPPRCPVCYRYAYATKAGNIGYHRDSIGRAKCPASGQPYYITGAGL